MTNNNLVSVNPQNSLGSSLQPFTMFDTANEKSPPNKGSILDRINKIFGTSLRFKTIIILTLLFLLMMAICLAILLSAFTTVFESVEYQQAKESSKRVSRALFDDFSQLTGKLFEYGAYTSTSDLLDGDLTQESINNYMDSNLNCRYMASAKVNMVFLYHMNGSLIISKHCFKNTQIEDVPSELTNLNDPSNQAIRNFFYNGINNVWTRHSGVLNLKENIVDFATSETSQRVIQNYTQYFTNLLLLSGMPIQNSAYDYSRGLIVFARYEMEDYFLDMADRTQLCLTIFDLKNSSDSNELKSSIGSYQYSKLGESSWLWTNISSVSSVTEWIDNEPSLISFLDSSNSDLINNRQCWSDTSSESISFRAGANTDRMASYQGFYSVTGSPSIIIRADIPRKTYQIGMASFLVVWCIMTFLIILMSIAIVVFVELIILRRVIKFSSHIEKVNNENMERVPRLGTDELGVLCKDVNIMLDEIERTQEKMKQDNVLIQELLEKTSLEEEKSRCVMNSIDDFIITVECSSGHLVTINHSFESRVLQKKKEKGEHASNSHSTQSILNYIKDFSTLEELLFKLESLSLTSGMGLYETSFKSGIGTIPVSISVNKVRMIMKHTIKSDAFVIVAKNLSDQQEMKETLKQQQDQLNLMKQNADFERVMSDSYLRQEFKEFCKKERAEENVIFLEKVMEYKKSMKTHERIKKQKEIIETFLESSCPMPINISQKVVGKEVKKIFDGYGQIELFDKLEKVIKSMILEDKFKRFFVSLQQKQMELDSASRSSIDRTSSSSDISYQNSFSNSLK